MTEEEMLNCEGNGKGKEAIFFFFSLQTHTQTTIMEKNGEKKNVK